MPTTALRLAGPADRPVLERLWLMFRHDLSEIRDVLPNPDGTFRSERLESALTDPGWAAYLMTTDDHPVGFALVRGLDRTTRVLNSFFIVRGARRRGLGIRAATDVVTRHPGAWEVAYQDENKTAARFWQRVATENAGESWTLGHRTVPGRPDLPPDTWIFFRTP